MKVNVSQRKVISVLCLLYYLQGIPYGIQTKVLPIYYYDVLKFPISFVTRIALLMSPWIILKPFIGQFVKSYNCLSRFLFTGLAACMCLNLCLYFVFSYSSSKYVFHSSAILLLINCATVCMDVATDQLAMSSSKSFDDLKFLGITNSIQIVAYKFGSMFSAMILFVLGYEKIHVMFLSLAIIYVLVVGNLYMYFPKNTNTDNSYKIKPNKFSWVENWLFNLRRIFCVNSTMQLMLYVLLYKLGETGAMTLFPILMIQSGSSRDSVSMIVSMIGEPLSLLGSLFGGLIWSVYKPVHPLTSLVTSLALVSFTRVFPLWLQMAFLTDPTTLKNSYYAPLSIGMLSFLGGLVSTLTFTLMMAIACQAPSDLQASHYALLSSVEVFGKLLFSSYTGTLSEHIDTIGLYVLFCLLTCASCLNLYFIRRSLTCDNITKDN